MKAVVVTHPGEADVLEYTEATTPCVKPGWSLVKVKGFGINRSEIFTRKGYSPSVVFPRILGIECVGVVAEAHRYLEGSTSFGKVIVLNKETE